MTKPMVRLAACCLALLAGCVRPPEAAPPAGPGRFGHSAIRKTVAPWDGLATEFVLAEEALNEHQTPGPCVYLRIYQGPPEALSGRRIRLEGKESRQGVAVQRSAAGVAVPLAWAELEFEEVRAGRPVAGTYDLAWPDGRRERGRFQAAWWAAEGPGG